MIVTLISGGWLLESMDDEDVQPQPNAPMGQFLAIRQNSVNLARQCVISLRHM